ncbi:MAG: GTPase HflX [Candidatus Fimousia sp.]|uniref:GTPase HflX n=1 Tax=Anaerostipes sp. 992a TaxID=1261637 RepID=UPI0009511EB1|nr:GTPase HflX [Anaerostipes sp. 992a]MDD5969744.1 GTPase HflX [Anaerostipes sp.]OLR63720.1 GTPase HflX [Anaerostipes sp. 992a]
MDNKMIYEENKKEEKVILAAVCLEEEADTKESLDELSELAKTAGAKVVGRCIQKREALHNATYLGSGKIKELKDLIWETDADGIICDDELSPAQLRNLEMELECKIMDRTLVILDIFASRARTKEGKIQVELAQLRYRATRLTGLGTSLSRLGGGIGTRGPGEKKLEMDRRLIRDRIGHLSRELKQVVRHREVQRQKRSKNHLPVVCIAGYTNAGKSTLLNLYTNAGVLEENQLFATLDPTTRQVRLESGQEILLTDTVGFIRKLPHHLVDAFRSTLEEAKYSDLILHVVDASNPQREKQMEAVYETLKQLGIQDKKMITVFNKIDQLEEETFLNDPHADEVIQISAKKGIHTDELLKLIEEVLQQGQIYLEKVYAYAEAGKISMIRKYGTILKEEYREEGIYIEAYVPAEVIHSV